MVRRFLNLNDPSIEQDDRLFLFSESKKIDNTTNLILFCCIKNFNTTLRNFFVVRKRQHGPEELFSYHKSLDESKKLKMAQKIYKRSIKDLFPNPLNFFCIGKR